MVKCAKCSKEIKTNDDLLVASYFLIPKPYHKECHSNILLKGIYPPLFNTAINVSWGRMILGLGLVFIIFAAYFFILSSKGMLENPIVLVISIFVFLFIFVLPIAERVYSYHKFEKKIEG